MDQRFLTGMSYTKYMNEFLVNAKRNAVMKNEEDLITAIVFFLKFISPEYFVVFG